MAIWMLQNMCSRQPPPLEVGELRNEIVVEAQRARDVGRFNRPDIIAATAKRFGISAAEINEYMFSDLPMERRLMLPDPIPDPHSLAIQTNLALARGLLNVASEINIELYGSTRAVVRQVHLRRLLCIAERSKSKGVQLKISGAFSLFRHTTMYGHALASILPLLLW